MSGISPFGATPLGGESVYRLAARLGDDAAALAVAHVPSIAVAGAAVMGGDGAALAGHVLPPPVGTWLAAQGPLDSQPEILGGHFIGMVQAPGPIGQPRLLGGHFWGGLSAASPIGQPAIVGVALMGILDAPSPLGRPALLGVSLMGRLLAAGPLGNQAKILGSLVVYGEAVAPCPIGQPAILGLHDYTTAVTNDPVFYAMDVSGTPPLRLPISSWQGTLRSDRQSYLQCSVPSVTEYAEELVARWEAGATFGVYRTAPLPNGDIYEYLMMEAPIQQVRLDRGSERYSATLIGYIPAMTPVAGVTRPLSGVQTVSSNGAYTRLRAAIDWLLQPGDVAQGGGLSFTVKWISYYIGEYGAYMDAGN